MPPCVALRICLLAILSVEMVLATESTADADERTAVVESPDNALRISFKDLNVSTTTGKNATSKTDRQIPASVKSLDGKLIRITGMMYPTRDQTGLKEFLLVQSESDFGGPPDPDKMVQVRLREGTSADFVKGRKLDVVGRLKVETNDQNGGAPPRYVLEEAFLFNGPTRGQENGKGALNSNVSASLPFAGSPVMLFCVFLAAVLLLAGLVTAGLEIAIGRRRPTTQISEIIPTHQDTLPAFADRGLLVVDSTSKDFPGICLKTGVRTDHQINLEERFLPRSTTIWVSLLSGAIGLAVAKKLWGRRVTLQLPVTDEWMQYAFQKAMFRWVYVGIAFGFLIPSMILTFYHAAFGMIGFFGVFLALVAAYFKGQRNSLTISRESENWVWVGGVNHQVAKLFPPLPTDGPPPRARVSRAGKKSTRTAPSARE